MSGTIVELRRVEFDALPSIQFTFPLGPGDKLSTTYDNVKLDVRLDTGAKLDIRSWIIDDDDNGVFHFEFAQDEMPAGRHGADLITYDLAVPTETQTVPGDREIVIVVRSRV